MGPISQEKKEGHKIFFQFLVHKISPALQTWLAEYSVEGILGRGILGRREFWVEQKLPINIKKSKFGCSND